MMTRRRTRILAVFALVAGLCARAEDEFEQEKYRGVLDLGPVGYWPADEGEGAVLHDRSGHDNHGVLVNVPWRNGATEFSNDRYQWAEIPHRGGYDSAAFSLGGWVFSRRTCKTSRVLFLGQPWMPRGGGFRWSGWASTPETDGILLAFGAAAADTGNALVSVICGGQADAVGSAAAGVSLATGDWQHVLCTRDEAGTVMLYVNGNATRSAADVPYISTGTPLIIGGDLEQWKVWPPDARSLDGSVRELVLFDRALTAEEVRRLYRATPAAPRPGPAADGTATFEGTEILLDGIPPASAADRRGAWEHVSRWDAARLRLAGDFLPTACVRATGTGDTRLAAVRCLAVLDTPAAREALRSDVVPLLIRVLGDAGLPVAERAEAALGLAATGPGAADAVPALLETLRSFPEADRARPPRIEDILRNATLRALLDIARGDAQVREAIGLCLAKPMLAVTDLSKPYPAEIGALVDAGRYSDALDVLRAHRKGLPRAPGHRYWGHSCPEDVRAFLPVREELFDNYLSKGNPFSDGLYSGPDLRPADYTPVDMHEGVTYMTVVERVPQEEVEEVFASSLKAPAGAEPSPEAKWSRVKVLCIDADGAEQEGRPEGPWFLFDARDAKMDGWAVGVDRDGYVHLVGGQHNSPNRGNYLPGTWEKMGWTAEGDGAPRLMYWVSRQPGGITEFEFVGRRDDPRAVPCGSMNYMNFARSPDGTLFLYGRDHVWTWGLYRYDAGARRWTGLGGSPVAMLEGAKKTNPGWHAGLGNTVPYYGPTPARVLVAAWQPGAYNFNRSGWGVRFDRTGRMHVQMGIWGVAEGGAMTNGPVYAYSDDLGETFCRADGTALVLPLTVNPIPRHHADMATHATRQWFDLWVSLLREAGCAIP